MNRENRTLRRMGFTDIASVVHKAICHRMILLTKSFET